MWGVKMMNKDKMIRKQIYLEPGQNDQIKRLSNGRGKTEAEIIREAIDNYLLKEKQYVEDPLQKLIGMVEAKINDGSLNHDQNIYVHGQNGGSHEKG